MHVNHFGFQRSNTKISDPSGEEPRNVRQGLTSDECLSWSLECTFQLAYWLWKFQIFKIHTNENIYTNHD